jgi:hypothetical protein
MDEDIFDILDDIRIEVQNRILVNQDLLKYLKYTSDDPLSNPDLTIDEAWEIVGGNGKEGNIYFQPRVTDTIQGDKSILTMITTTRKTRNGLQSFATVTMTFIVLVHYNNFELIDGRSRMNRICKCLKSVFDNARGVWIGKMAWDDFGDITAPSNYNAMKITFTSQNFR